jgi:O-antigen/teichoic acid export membrane protein
MVVSVGANGVTMVLALVNGIITARLLEPSGRGQFAAIVTWAATVQTLSAIGIKDALLYLEAKDPDAAPRLLGTAVALVGVLGLLGVAVSQLLLPLAFSDQSSDVLHLAQVFMLMGIPIMATEALYCLLNGHQRFTAATVSLVVQPFLATSALLVLLVSGGVSVRSVLLAHTGSYVVVSLAMFAFLWRIGGLGPPSVQLARAALAYGVRLQGHILGSLGNSRLDLLIMPAFLAASQIGYYSVAVSAASMLVGLFGGLKPIVFAAAARGDEASGTPLVERTVRISVAGSLVLALGLALGGPVLIRLLYGSDFLSAVTPMRLLLPGLVVWTAAGIVASGLNAADRPTKVSISQLLGLAVTIVLLALLLPPFGIIGAAIASTLAYSTVFAMQLRFLSRETAFDVRRALSLGLLVDDARSMTRSARALVARRAGA